MLHLRTFGGLALQSDSGALTGAAVQRRPLALLAILAVAGERGVSRERLQLLLWSESDTERARRVLAQTVYALRRDLGDPAVIQGTAELQLSSALVAADVAEFENAIRAGNAERAAELYEGPFLDGVHLTGAPEFERWVDSERGRLAERAKAVLVQSAKAARSRGDIDASIRWWRRLAGLDPLDAKAAVGLMEVLAASGDTAGALRHARVYESLMREDLEAPPDPQVTALAERLRARKAPRSPASAPATDEPDTISSLAPRTAAPNAPEAAAPSGLPGTSARTTATRLRWRTAAPIGIALLAIGGAWLAVRAVGEDEPTVAPARPDDSPRVVVADFDTPTGDSVLARIAREALRVDLAASRSIRLLPPQAVRQALVRMSMETQGPVDATLARQIAIREGVPAVLTGQVSRVGATVLLTAELRASSTEDVLAAARDEAADSSDFIAALGRLSAKLRASFGEPLGAIEAGPPLARVTTHSLEALRRYTLAVEALDVHGDFERGSALLEEAIGIDSGFAMAHRKLAVARENEGEWTRALDAYEQAYRHRERLPDVERLLVTADYFDAIGDPEKAVAALQSLVAEHPHHAVALNFLGYLETQLGRPREAAGYYSLALAADSTLATAAANLASAHFNAGDTAAARQSIATLQRSYLGFPRTLLQLAYHAAAEGDLATADRWIRRLETEHGQQPVWAFASANRLADLAALRGRLTEAEAHLERSLERAHAEDRRDQYWADIITLAGLSLHLRHDTARALRQIERATSVHPLSMVPVSDRPYVDLAWLLADAGQPERARALLVELRAVSDRRRRTELARRTGSIEAAIALAEGRFDDAVRSLDDAHDPVCPICLLRDKGRALAAAGRVEDAAREYERYLSTPYFPRLTIDGIGMPDALVRLAALHARMGDSARAAAYRRRLAELWAGADAGALARLTNLP